MEHGLYLEPVRVDVVTPPTGTLVTTEDFAAHASLDANDPVVASKLAAAVARIEGPDGFLGKYMRRTVLKAVTPDAVGYASAIPWYVKLPGGNIDRDTVVANIINPTAPVPSVTVTAKALRLRDGWYGKIDNFVSQDSHVEITYTVGGETIPQPVKEAVMKLAAHLYTNRDLGPSADVPAMYADIYALVNPWVERGPWG